MHYWTLNMPYAERINWDIVLSWFGVVIIGFLAYYMARIVAKNL